MTDCTRIPTLDEIYESKDAMDDIQLFTYSNADSFVDSKSVVRDTVNGRLKKMGYDAPVGYGAGIVFNVGDNLKTIEEDGTKYSPVISALPFTTSGTFIGDDDTRFQVVQGLTNDQLINESSQTFNFDLMSDLLANTILFPINKIIETKGFDVVNDGGGAQWVRTSLVGTPGIVNPTLGTWYDANGIGYTYMFSAAVASKEVNPLAFGCKVDGGITDNSNIFQQLTVFADVLIIPTNELGLGLSNISVPIGKFIKGNGYKSKVFAIGGLDFPVFTLQNDSQVSNFRITGSDGRNSGLLGQHGIYLTNQFRTNSNNLWIDGLGGDGYFGLHASAAGVHDGSSLDTIKVTDCNGGINIGERFEYVNMDNCTSWDNNVGLVIRGGNLNGSNNIVTDNIIGIKLVAGSNDAHGQLIGTLINHNIDNAITVDGPENGFTFIGAQIFGNGPIHLKDCERIKFIGGAKGTTDILEENCFDCAFVNFDFTDGINNTPNYNSSISQVFYHNNFLPSTIATQSFDGLNGAALSLTQNATVPVPVGTSDFIFDTTNYNAITANPNYFQEFYSAAGVFDGLPRVVGGFDINFKLQICIGVNTNTSMVADDVIITLQSVATGDIFAILTPLDTPTVADAATLIRYVLNGPITREAVKIVIENKLANPVQVFNDKILPGLFTRGFVTGW